MTMFLMNFIEQTYVIFFETNQNNGEIFCLYGYFPGS